MKTLTEITELLEGMNDSELFTLWNDYCQEANNSDAMVFEFDDQFFEDYFSDPQEAARATFFGDINSWSDKYIMFNGYGNLESSNYISTMISISDLASHIEDNIDNYTDLLED